MSREIRHLSLPSDLDSVVALHGRAFSDATADLAGQILHNVASPQGAEVLGAYEGGRLIGVNAFIRHRLANGALIYQSCSSATDPEYRGKGVFSSIVEYAKSHLAGGECIIGFPNQNSAPIFLRNLGFSSKAQSRVICPVGMASRIFGNAKPDLDEEQLIEWKLARYGSEIVSLSVGSAHVWGKVFLTKIGPFRVPALDVGGVCRNKLPTPTRMPRLLVFSASTDSVYIQRSYFLPRKRAGLFIYFPLGTSRDSKPPVNFLLGLADFF